MFKLLQQEWKKYILEILVIIIGISISFILDEWRQDLKEREVEIHTLAGIRDNLAADTLFLANRIKVCDTFLWSYSQVLQYEKEGFQKDSLNLYFDHILSYLNFEATNIGYEKLKQTGHSSLISNKPLLNDIIKFYGLYVGIIQEWNDIDEQFILRDIIPYTLEKIPYTPEGSFPFSDTDDILQLIKSDDIFKNKIKMNKVYKGASRKVYKGVLKKMKSLLNNINTEIERLKS